LPEKEGKRDRKRKGEGERNDERKGGRAREDNRGRMRERGGERDRVGGGGKPERDLVVSFYVIRRRKIHFPQMSETAILQQEPAMTSEVKLSETETICMLDKPSACSPNTYLSAEHTLHTSPHWRMYKAWTPVYYVGREVEGGENGRSHNQK
jgi:hypothetical protein